LRSLAELVDAPSDLMPRDQRKPDAREHGIDESDVAVADPAGLYGNPYMAGARLAFFTLDDLERPAGGGYLRGSIRTHLDLSRA
jgi:hypothetical protein